MGIKLPSSSGGGDWEDQSLSEINITPFVDVVLVLLVIFMVTAPMMATQLIKFNLPKSKTSTANEENKSVGIVITAKGQYFWEGKLQDLDQIKEMASILSKETLFLIAADTESKHGDLIKLVDVLRSLGLYKYSFQVEAQEK